MANMANNTITTAEMAMATDSVLTRPTLEKKDSRLVNEETKSDAEIGASAYYIDPVKEAKMMRKFDLYAIVPIGIMYMMASLDRSNLGNANIAGMPEEIGLTGNQFGIATTLLFATYVPLEGPIGATLKVIGPKLLLSVCAVGWGLTCLGMGFIQDYKGLYACRLLLGFFEASIAPCQNVYLGWVYKKSERGKRSSLIFAFSAVASGFGGIMAYGLTQLHGPHGFSGWRWLFVVEGIMTVLLVPAFFWVFPKEPTTAWFLTEEEKRLMLARYEADPSWGHDEEFSIKECIKAFKDPKWYAFSAYQFCVDITLYGFTTFLPAIVRGLGYQSIHANLMTAPIYFCALAFFLLIAYFSDKTGLRGPFMAGPLLCLVIGYAMLITIDNLKIRFFACFVIALGAFPGPGLSLMWLQDNAARHTKRATMVGFALCIGNSAGAAVGQIFTTQSAPRYISALSIALGLSCVAIAIVVGLMASMAYVNRRRAAKILAAEQAGTPLPNRPEDGDYNVYFKYGI